MIELACTFDPRRSVDVMVVFFVSNLEGEPLRRKGATMSMNWSDHLLHEWVWSNRSANNSTIDMLLQRLSLDMNLPDHT